MNVDLPSSDEEDDDYDPAQDFRIAEKRAREELLDPRSASLHKQVDRARKGGLAELPELAEQRKRLLEANANAEHANTGANAGAGIHDREADASWQDLSRKRSRQARVDQAWNNLKGLGKAKSPTGEERRRSGKGQGQGQGQGENEKKAFAAEAMRTMKEAAKFGFKSSGSKGGRVLVKETRNFAGKDVEVVREVDAGTKMGAKAIEKSKQKEKKHGLDYVLQLLDRNRKLNIIDKSKLDWKEYKREHKQVQEELNNYTKGGERYTEKQEFLKRTEMREYEMERDAKLASNARNRGRL